ncbi:hypothetical protein MPH_11387 [Macrophomina phaseolina MS6]|uniref:Protein kinase domain-containing protein n=1 Tax=Macrophomina phaseolina (strain MS6) TaxID=1126212 RepID=K2RAH8_MACPH|nr:hypothetical protein MPH_11387 [Macrophomina phaseolina MS6]
MNSFYEQDFQDKDLLLNDNAKCKRLNDDVCSHPASLNLLHNEKLWRPLKSVQSFFDERWIFLAPVFSRTEFRHTLSPNTILPFEMVEEDDSKNFVGGFSKVQRATIYFSHQTIIPTNGSGLSVAIKELQQVPDPSYPRPETAWEMELRAIDGLRHHVPTTHKHLIPAIGAFQRCNRYYLIFQWADGGSLQKFWEKNRKPSLSPEFIENVLLQLRGLADALCCMHSGPRTAVFPAGKSDHWRHGDIKPDNILRFKCTGEQMDLGTLQIADLGLAVCHTMATKDRRAATNMRYGTLKYEGPEAHPFAANLSARSRRYDLWSLGCVVLEFTIWMLFGHEGLEQFNKEPHDPHGMETNFYKVEVGAHMEVHEIAKRWMEIIKNDQEMNYEGRPTALHDLLKIVERRLLVVKTDNGAQTRGSQEGYGIENVGFEYRATAEEFKGRLESMIEKGKKNRRYLFTGKDRKDIKCPQANIKERSQRKATGQGRQSLHPGTLTSSDIPDNSRIVVDTHVPVPSLPQNLSDTWTFSVDNKFPDELLPKLDLDSTIFPQPTTKALCEYCQSSDFSASSFRFEHTIDCFSTLQVCRLCSILNQACNSRGLSGSIVIVREGSTLNKEGTNIPILSMCRGPEAAEPLKGIQIGFPNPPQGESEHRFKVMHQWLEHCNKNPNHRCCPEEPGSLVGGTTLPKRVIEVNVKGDPELVRLSRTVGKRGHYLALSHRWGRKDPDDPPFSTTRSNIDKHINGIRISDLPATFRDAVKVARKLGISYLWIDSLCIVQGPDKDDWNEQANCMESIFSSAYCVIAATQASCMSDGFLKSSSPQDFVTLLDKSGRQFYVCEAIDDFERQVTEAELNRRGWVYQERALARRTIHFANEQMYWECGDGIRCETLARMHNSQAALLGDPDFPSVAKAQSKGGIIVFYEAFYKQYSRLALTKNTDRPIAIAGLEKRLIRALGVHGGFGILGADSYLGRSLLWKRAFDQRSMEKIQFRSESSIMRVPSWSWMSYEGAIDYLDAPLNQVAWEVQEIQSPWALKISQQFSWHTADRPGNTTLTAVARGFSDTEEGEIIYDRGHSPATQELKCVVIGRSKSEEASDLKTHYVLVIDKQGNAGWERVGVGKLMGKSLMLEGAGTRVTIS